MVSQRQKDILTNGNNMDQNVENVVSQLRAREERGLSKYGVNTERTDLSTIEWLQHLQEELMDGAVYIEKLKKELKGTERKRLDMKVMKEQ